MSRCALLSLLLVTAAVHAQVGNTYCTSRQFGQYCSDNLTITACPDNRNVTCPVNTICSEIITGNPNANTTAICRTDGGASTPPQQATFCQTHTVGMYCFDQHTLISCPSNQKILCGNSTLCNTVISRNGPTQSYTAVCSASTPTTSVVAPAAGQTGASAPVPVPTGGPGSQSSTAAYSTPIVVYTVTNVNVTYSTLPSSASTQVSFFIPPTITVPLPEVVSPATSTPTITEIVIPIVVPGRVTIDVPTTTDYIIPIPTVVLPQANVTVPKPTVTQISITIPPTILAPLPHGISVNFPSVNVPSPQSVNVNLPTGSLIVPSTSVPSINVTSFCSNRVEGRYCYNSTVVITCPDQLSFECPNDGPICTEALIPGPVGVNERNVTAICFANQTIGNTTVTLTATSTETVTVLPYVTPVPSNNNNGSVTCPTTVTRTVVVPGPIPTCYPPVANASNLCLNARVPVCLNSTHILNCPTGATIECPRYHSCIQVRGSQFWPLRTPFSNMTTGVCALDLRRVASVCPNVPTPTIPVLTNTSTATYPYNNKTSPSVTPNPQGPPLLNVSTVNSNETQLVATIPLGTPTARP